MRGTSLCRESARRLAPGRARPRRAEALRATAKDALGFRAPLDLRDRSVRHFLAPAAPVPARRRRFRGGRALLHAGRRARLALAHLRADVRGAPDGRTRARRRIPLRLLEGETRAGWILLRALRGVRIPVGAGGGDRLRGIP